jgi:hypothetical protein
VAVAAVQAIGALVSTGMTNWPILPVFLDRLHRDLPADREYRRPPPAHPVTPSSRAGHARPRSSATRRATSTGGALARPWSRIQDPSEFSLRTIPLPAVEGGKVESPCPRERGHRRRGVNVNAAKIIGVPTWAHEPSGTVRRVSSRPYQFSA